MSALEPRHLTIVERWTQILSALVVAASWVALPRAMAFGVAVGCLLMVLNALAIRKLSERLFDRALGEPRPGPALLAFNLKLLALVALVYLAIAVARVDVIGLLIGVSVFPVAVVVTALRLNLGADGQGDDGNSAGATPPDAAPPPTPTGDH